MRSRDRNLANTGRRQNKNYQSAKVADLPNIFRMAEIKASTYQFGYSYVSVTASISKIREIKTRDGRTMASFKLLDETGTIEVIVIPALYPKVMEFIGKLPDDDNEQSPPIEVKAYLERDELTSELQLSLMEIELPSPTIVLPQVLNVPIASKPVSSPLIKMMNDKFINRKEK